MPTLPVHKRKFHAFLSHAHADKTIVDRLYAWLAHMAEIPIWYDSQNLPAGANIVSHLASAISECRALLLVLSKSSIKSGWVEEEYNAAMAQRTQYRDYRILPIRLEDCDPPGFLQTTKWIDLRSADLPLNAASELLACFDLGDGDLELMDLRDVYVSRGWHESENALADTVCRHLDKKGFRLIGDAKDQPGLDQEQRVRSILSSCGALAAVLPDRGSGATSKNILSEVDLARKMGLACLIVAEPNVKVPAAWAKDERCCVTRAGDDAGFKNGLAMLDEKWHRPDAPHYVFFSTSFDPGLTDRNREIRKLIQRVTGLPCLIGNDIREGQIQEVIAERIRRAFVMIADVAESNPDTYIEAGIARGARTRFHLAAREPRQRTPFTFRDQQIWSYGSDVDLLGVIRRIVFPYRRRVLNAELKPDHARGSSRPSQSQTLAASVGSDRGNRWHSGLSPWCARADRGSPQATA